MKAHGTRIITVADGHHIIDSDGNRIFDAMAGLWCVNVGYGRQELIEAASANSTRCPITTPSSKRATPRLPPCRKKLAAISPTGSTMSSTPIPAQRRTTPSFAWSAISGRFEGRPKKQKIISRTYGYHGSTTIAASMGGMTAMHEQGAQLPDFHHIKPPYGFLYQGNMDEATFETVASRLMLKLPSGLIMSPPSSLNRFRGRR